MRVYVAGHRGMVGSAVVRQLEKRAECDLITATSAKLDLRDQAAVRQFMQAHRPDMVVLAAARVGGILANSRFPADFIYDNLMIATNVIHQAHAAGVTRLLQLGSSCIYPREAAQPMTEQALLAGPLEPTNEPYAIAKIAAIKLCESYNRQYGTDYRSIMPTNLYGPNDNFHPENAHVLPAMIRRFHEARAEDKRDVTIWGTGTPRREFLHVDDLAKAAIFVMDLDRQTYEDATSPMCSQINVGSGVEITIHDLASTIAKITGFGGEIRFDVSKPDGTPRKLMDTSRLTGLGWRPAIDLAAGIADTCEWYRLHIATDTQALDTV